MLSYIKTLTNNIMWKSKTKEEEVITNDTPAQENKKEMSTKEVVLFIAETELEWDNPFKEKIAKLLKEAAEKMQ